MLCFIPFDGWFICSHSHNREFPPIVDGFVCDANRMKSEEEAAAATAAATVCCCKRSEGEISMQFYQCKPGAMRWFNHCTVYFSVGVDCLVSHLKLCTVCVHVCACVCFVEFNWIETKPHQFMHTNALHTKPNQFTNTPLQFSSFHQFITDRAVIWM